MWPPDSTPHDFSQSILYITQEMAAHPLRLSTSEGLQGKEGVIFLNLSPKSGAQASYLAPTILCTVHVSAAILFPASLARRPVLTQ